MKAYVIVLFVLLSSCNDANYSSADSGVVEPTYRPEQIKVQESHHEESSEDIAPSDQMLIKTGSLSFQVDDVQEKHDKILNSLSQYDAYVVNDQNFSSSDRISYSMQIRVPKHHFDSFVAEVIKGNSKIDHKRISVEDVTEEFIDIEARLKTKKELETRYLELLDQANIVSEMLEIEQKLGELQADMESIQTRLNYLQQQVQYSTLHLDFYQKISIGNQFGQKFTNGFKNGWNNLIWFLIGLVNIWPFILISAFLLYLFLRMIRRRKRRG